MERILIPALLEPESILETLNAIQTAICDDSVQAIVFEGNQDIFCSGMSFDYLAGTTDLALDKAKTIDLFGVLIQTIHFSIKPTIALIQGKALAGGAGLAAACDFVIAGKNAAFGFSEPLFGLLPGMILPFLLQRISPKKVQQLMISANSITAENAFAIGLVDELVDAEQLEKILHYHVKNFSRVNARGVGKIKKILAETINTNLDDAVQKGGALLKHALNDEQVMNNIRNYTEHGIVPWKTEEYEIN